VTEPKDIVDELRGLSHELGYVPPPQRGGVNVCDRAAKEIERLRARLKAWEDHDAKMKAAWKAAMELQR